MRNILAIAIAALAWTTVTIASVQAGPESPNERSRDAVCATGCSGGG